MTVAKNGIRQRRKISSLDALRRVNDPGLDKSRRELFKASLIDHEKVDVNIENLSLWMDCNQTINVAGILYLCRNVGMKRIGRNISLRLKPDQVGDSYQAMGGIDRYVKSLD